MRQAAFARLKDRLKRGISLSLCLSLMMPNLVLAGQIILDGKTDTTVTPNGNDTTEVYTDTLRGSNAFNSFDFFNIDSGETVNLHIPSGASNLLNLVNKDTSTINGVVNSLKDDGLIGGNVFFLNPHGFILGTEGVLNVGSLTMLTPTADFVDNFFAGSEPQTASVTQVLEGKVPISGSGLITVQGKINALSDIRLAGGKVAQSGEITAGSRILTGSVDFGDLVNLDGLEITAQEITVSDGALITAIAPEGNPEGGNIALNAIQIDETSKQEAVAAAKISIGAATISGNNISLSASSDAKFDWGGLDALLKRKMIEKLGPDMADVAVSVPKLMPTPGSSSVTGRS